jgi:hypothetical protein
MAAYTDDELVQGWHYTPPPPAKQVEEVALKRLAASNKKAAARAPAAAAPLSGSMTHNIVPFLQAMQSANMKIPKFPTVPGGPSGPSGPQGGVPSGGPGVQRLAGRIAGADNINQITNRVNRWALKRGATLTSPQGHHDAEGAYERDFSFHAGTSGAEKRLLRKLYKAFTIAYGTQGQRAYTEGDHWDHLHFGTGAPGSDALQELIFGRKAIFR